MVLPSGARASKLFRFASANLARDHLHNSQDAFDHLEELVLWATALWSPGATSRRTRRLSLVPHPPARRGRATNGIPGDGCYPFENGERGVFSPGAGGGQNAVGLPSIDNGPLDVVFKAQSM
jgi:hypothetical protein